MNDILNVYESRCTCENGLCECVRARVCAALICYEKFECKKFADGSEQFFCAENRFSAHRRKMMSLIHLLK